MDTADQPDHHEQVDRASIIAELGFLEALMRQMVQQREHDILAVDPTHLRDAANLVHYLALRHGDVSHLQRWLGERGLSSLGRCEPHVLATVESVRAALDGTAPTFGPAIQTFKEGRRALDHNTDALFGPRPTGHVTRIMVTLPTEAADDYSLVKHLVRLGMDVARINGAHDDPDVWERMARQVRRASDDVSRSCRISMDLPGPKLRTGPLSEGPHVVKLRPERDLRGVPITPAVVRFSADPVPASGGTALAVDPSWIQRRRLTDIIRYVNTHGARREMRVTAKAPRACDAEIWDTTYMETGTALSCHGDVAHVGELPSLPQAHLLHVGDVLVLTRDLDPATPWRRGQPGFPRIGCTWPVAFQAVKGGERVIFDDGKITGIIESSSSEELHVRITSAAAKGSRLRSERGINLPDTDLAAAAVSDADLPLLEVAAAHADMVAVSFLRHETDVDDVHTYLRRVGAEHLGLVLKIETAAAFVRLPEILLHAMRSPLVGVMIARGDLAVEAGYERLAEVQEEILWLCEAAHLPVIWATEVLDQLARTGKPSRAEVTDAAMSQRAECVMLNKGPHIDSAMIVLDDILRRMSRHQRKKTALLQPLASWSDRT